MSLELIQYNLAQASDGIQYNLAQASDGIQYNLAQASEGIQKQNLTFSFCILNFAEFSIRNKKKSFKKLCFSGEIFFPKN
jgi:hypothetical protein